MMKYLLLALSLGLPGTALAQGTLAEGKLAVGSDLTYPPYNYFADGNVPAVCRELPAQALKKPCSAPAVSSGSSSGM